MSDSDQPSAKVLFRVPGVDGSADVETSNSKFFSITVPPGSNLDVVRQYLNEQNATFEHADPPYDDLFPDG